MGNEILTVVAMLRAKPGEETIVKHELEKLVSLSRAEAGCLNYDLHQTINDPELFVFHENWTDEAALEAHSRSEHIISSRVLLNESLASREVFRMRRIGP